MAKAIPTQKPMVKIPSHVNKTPLNEAYRNFNTAKYWAAHNGATYKEIYPVDFQAYKGYVEGNVDVIVSSTAKIVEQYGEPAFKKGKAGNVERETAREKYLATHPTRQKKISKEKGRA